MHAPLFTIALSILEGSHDFFLVLLAVISLFSSMLLYSRIRLIGEKTRMIKEEKNKYKKLLYNVFPQKVANEMMENGYVEPKKHEEVTILFTDFVSFTSYSEKAKPIMLVKHLDEIFSMFDSIILHRNVEKIKTIGDSYMCAAGIPTASATHAEDMARVALEFREYIQLFRKLKAEEGFDFPDIRIGIHTGSVIAGTIGVSRAAYDVWGDTVNVAKRMENRSEPGKINISEPFYEKLKSQFDCTQRESIEVKGKGLMQTFFLNDEK